MAPKKKSLAAAIKADTAPTATVAPEPAAIASALPTKTAKAREGKRHIGGYYPPEVVKEFKKLATDLDLTIEAALGRAINMLFEANGKNPIAPDR